MWRPLCRGSSVVVGNWSKSPRIFEEKDMTYTLLHEICQLYSTKKYRWWVFFIDVVQVKQRIQKWLSEAADHQWCNKVGKLMGLAMVLLRP